MRTLIGFLSGIILASASVVAVRAHNEPSCPTEDSCQIDYQHGKGWVVREVQP